jgi:hypothetical protein
LVLVWRQRTPGGSLADAEDACDAHSPKFCCQQRSES